jgi:hypothetical protein
MTREEEFVHHRGMETRRKTKSKTESESTEVAEATEL